MAPKRTVVLCHLPVDYLYLADLEKRFPQVDFIPVPTSGEIPSHISGDIILTAAAEADNLVGILKSEIRWIHCTGHGVDHLPLSIFGDRLVTCSRGISAEAISEWVIAMILAWAKRLPTTWVSEPPKQWFLAHLDRLAEATVLLVGLGSINLAVAERLTPFGCRILAIRRTNKPPPLETVKVIGSLEEAISEADHLVLAAPLTLNTHHLVNQKLLASAKKGIHIVNVARGEIIDQEALRLALEDGTVGRASLDVADPEPLPSGHWLYQHPRVLFSPHISWTDPRYLQRATNTFADNLERWLTKQQLSGQVDLEAGY